MPKRVMLASLVIAAAVAPASAQEHKREFAPQVMRPQAAQPSHAPPPQAHPAAPPPQAARPQPPPQAARPQPPPQAARPQPPHAPPPQAARPQPPQATQPWREHARPQPPQAAPQATQPPREQARPEPYRGRFDEGHRGYYGREDYARRFEGRHFARPRVDVHHYARRYSRLPDFRVYGSWGLAAPLRAYPDLSFLDDAMLVGSYVWEGRVVYVYLLDEDGERHELRVDEYGNMLSDVLVP